ncbi:MAG: SIMPL domain-containing protein [Desulfurivibrio sp.]|nr:SIMPL domain-containing protein [Desulfurivibrio sp.]
MIGKKSLVVLTLGCWLLITPVGRAAAETVPGPNDGFTVHLRATAGKEVANDLLTATLGLERRGEDSGRLATAVAKRMQRALGEAQGYPEVKVETGAYRTLPVYQRRDGVGELVGWRVRQQLRLESTDIEAATALIGRLQGFELQLQNLDFTISKEQKEQHRAELTTAALAAWREKAQVAVQGLGGESWRPHEVRIEAQHPGSPRALAARVDNTPAESLPPALEAGISELRITVSGTAWGR